MGPERCLAIVGLTGDPGVVGAAARAVDDLVRGSQGIAGPGIGSAWRHSRFSAPYLRNALWDAGYAVDTLETATDWTALPGAGRRARADAPPRAGGRRASASTRSATCRTAIRAARACTRHTSSASPRTPTRRSTAGGRSRPPPAGSSSSTGRRSATSTASAPTTPPYLAGREGPARDGGHRGRSSGRSTRTGGWRAASCSRTP